MCRLSWILVSTSNGVASLFAIERLTQRWGLTGTSLIGVPLATAGKMYTSVPGVVPASAISNGHYGTGYWALPCDSNATVAFGEHQEKIPVSD